MSLNRKINFISQKVSNRQYLQSYTSLISKNNPLLMSGLRRSVYTGTNDRLANHTVYGRHVKPLVPAAFAVVSTRQSALGNP
jgi:hypothetical protein